MSTVIFDITPEELEASATRVSAKAAEFARVYNSLKIAVEELKINYKGEASDTFNRKINERGTDFAAADAALKRYVDTVRDYARTQRSNEGALKNQASAL